jgi:CheY-like chemotaxis protein
MATILLVDDNPLRASLRLSILERSVQDVVRATDASEALCLVESQEFASGLRLVITGHQMSAISGPEFVAELRSRLPLVPVLVLSAHAVAEAEYEGISQVFHSQANSTDELRMVVTSILRSAEKQTA